MDSSWQKTHRKTPEKIDRKTLWMPDERDWSMWRRQNCTQTDKNGEHSRGTMTDGGNPTWCMVRKVRTSSIFQLKFINHPMTFLPLLYSYSSYSSPPPPLFISHHQLHPLENLLLTILYLLDPLDYPLPPGSS